MIYSCGSCGLFANRQPCPRCGTQKQEPEQSEIATQRMAICQACDHRQDNRCGILIDRGKPGYLMHHKGLPNPSAKCPDGKWHTWSREEKQADAPYSR